MENYDFLVGLRAIRSFTDEPLSEDDLNSVLEAARWTGSAKNAQHWAFIVVQDDKQRRRLAEAGAFADPILAAPATIAIVEEEHGYEFDTGRVAQNIMLGAAAIGVASCPITLHREHIASDVLGLSDSQRCGFAVVLGYPSADAAPARFGGRKPLENLVHWERY